MLRVERSQWLAPTVLLVTLIPEDAIPIKAGQYVTLTWPSLHDGNTEPSNASTRNSSTSLILSLACDPNLSGTWDFHIRSIPDSSLAQLILNTPTHTLVRVSEAKGHCLLPEVMTTPLVFIAGGTGFAPARALLQAALGNTTQSVTLHWGVRQLSDFYAEAEVNEWLKAYPNFHFYGYLSDSEEQHPNFTLGFPYQNLDFLKEETQPSNHKIPELYVFGPPSLVQATWRALVAWQTLNSDGKSACHMHADFPLNA